MKKVEIKKNYVVTFFLDGVQDSVKFCCAQYDALLHDCKKWYRAKYDEGYDKPSFEIKEIVAYKSATALFLDNEKVRSLKLLFGAVKGLTEYYLKENEILKYKAIRRFSESMKNNMQNEFYASANICDNTVWSWTDKFKAFDKETFLHYMEGRPVKLDQWTMFLMTADVQRTRSILDLVREWNLDNQPQDYVMPFKEDFMACKSDQQFCKTLLKWTDLIRWNPENLSLYDGSIPQPRPSHYEDEINPEFDSDAFLD